MTEKTLQPIPQNKRTLATTINVHQKLDNLQEMDKFLNTFNT